MRYGIEKNTSPPLPAMPGGGQVVRFERSYDDRLWLLERRWIPAGPIRATLIIVHGTVDHSGYYDDLGRALAAEGVAVVAQDMRGWGLSDGESYYFHDRTRFVADVVALQQRLDADAPFAGVKHRFLLGKSIGGLVTAYTVLAHPTMFSGLVGLSGAYGLDPAVGIPPAPVVSLLRVLARLLPKLPVRRLFDDRMLIRDPAALAALRSDPWFNRGRLRLGYVAEMLGCNGDLPLRVGELHLPMLMMWGSDDRVVTRAGHELMAQKSASTDATFKVYEGGLHNLLQEPDLGPVVIRDVVHWILEHSK
ncbi:MAG: lysophospholipase [Myxococcales bacterium]|nr:lysophospholipase [Myxococcales bacterium]